MLKIDLVKAARHESDVEEGFQRPSRPGKFIENEPKHFSDCYLVGNGSHTAKQWQRMSKLVWIADRLCPAKKQKHVTL